MEEIIELPSPVVASDFDLEDHDDNSSLDLPPAVECSDFEQVDGNEEPELPPDDDGVFEGRARCCRHNCVSNHKGLLEEVKTVMTTLPRQTRSEQVFQHLRDLMDPSSAEKINSKVQDQSCCRQFFHQSMAVSPKTIDGMRKLIRNVHIRLPEPKKTRQKSSKGSSGPRFAKADAFLLSNAV